MATPTGNYNPNLETWDQYQARRTDLGNPQPNTGTNPAPDATTQTNTGADAFFAEITKRMLGDKSGTSSVNPALTTIDEAVKQLQEGLKAGQQGIKAQYEQKRGRMAYDFEQSATGAREGMMNLGGASSLAIMTQLDERNRRAMNDLNLAEQQALATGQYEVAAKVADLKIQRAQFQMDSEKEAFSNMMQAAGLFLQRQQEERLTAASKFDQNAKMGEIALQYGLQLKPGDTLDSVITRAMPMASEDRKLQLQKMRAEIAATNRSGAGGGSVSREERLRGALAGSIGALQATQGRRTAQGGDTYYNPDTYIAERNKYIAAGGLKSEFDSQFGWNLNPLDSDGVIGEQALTN